MRVQIMADRNSFVIYCKRQELYRKWRKLSILHKGELLPKIITGIGASEHGEPRLIIYFSVNSGKDSRKVVMNQIISSKVMTR